VLKRFKELLPNLLYYVCIVGFVWGVSYLTRSCNEDTARWVYRKDPRTGVCYVLNWWRTSFAYIPCEKVPRGQLK